MKKPDLTKETIRIGTLANASGGVNYLKQILPHGFECFQLTFWQKLGGVDVPRLAGEVRELLAGTGVVISSLGIYGNPLEDQAVDAETLRAWEVLIDNAHLFGADLVCGFTGRLRGKPIDASIPRFKKVFGALAKRAAGKGVRLA